MVARGTIARGRLAAAVIVIIVASIASIAINEVGEIAEAGIVLLIVARGRADGVLDVAAPTDV